MPVLGYCVTSNHVHVVIHAEAQEPVSAMMRLAAGCTAGQYNQRKGRRGGFWDGRFRCTAVESGEHLLSCLAYVDMNMVRAGVVEHPPDWNWCGYREVAGLDLDNRGRTERSCWLHAGYDTKIPHIWLRPTILTPKTRR